jgi:regulator of replication initiation timing
MSTSPSWFDQEKFTRLVKKVGKTVPLSPHEQPPGAEADNRPPGEGLASTARISLVSKPPSLLSENRALPALPRRTSALPSLRTHFQPAPQNPPQPLAQSPTAAEPASRVEEPNSEAGVAEKSEQTNASTPLNDEDLGELWQKMALLNEELAYAVQERDHALHENAHLVELLRESQEASKQTAAPVSTGKTQELHLVSQERDSARKDYAELRKQFETLKKQEQVPKEDSSKIRKELEAQLEAKNKEIAALKATPTAAGGGDVKMKEEMIALREQLAKAKEEASVAQRGLMLSQKALHETRDTLREATEGTSLSRHNFDNLKNECATLVQQNQVLQAQNDQLTRDLAAAKSKLTSRL